LPVPSASRARLASTTAGGAAATSSDRPVGAAVAYWTAALLEAQLYRVSPFSPAVWLTSAGVLLAVATLATVIPSIRQTCIDPAQALRAE
jgi:hypothetical protein